MQSLSVTSPIYSVSLGWMSSLRQKVTSLLTKHRSIVDSCRSKSVNVSSASVVTSLALYVDMERFGMTKVLLPSEQVVVSDFRLTNFRWMRHAIFPSCLALCMRRLKNDIFDGTTKVLLVVTGDSFLILLGVCSSAEYVSSLMYLCRFFPNSMNSTSWSMGY